MRYKIYLEECGYVDDLLICGVGMFIGETDDLRDALGIALTAGAGSGTGAIVMDPEYEQTWWYDQNGELYDYDDYE